MIYGASFLFMMDYILTYLGIHYFGGEELNPCMVWLFQLSFIEGYFLRMLMLAVIVSLLAWIRNKLDGHKTADGIFLFIQLIPMFVHMANFMCMLIP